MNYWARSSLSGEIRPRVRGNGWLLPAGPLREPWPRRALRCAGQGDESLLVLHTGVRPAISGFRARRSLSPVARRQDGTTVALSALSETTVKPLMAIAGIATPESFFGMLRANGLHLSQTLGLPDHYYFDSNISSISEGYSLICTDKDAVKLWAIVPSAWSVSLVFEPESAFFSALQDHLSTIYPAQLSLTDGH